MRRTFEILITMLLLSPFMGGPVYGIDNCRAIFSSPTTSAQGEPLDIISSPAASDSLELQAEDLPQLVNSNSRGKHFLKFVSRFLNRPETIRMSQALQSDGRIRFKSDNQTLTSIVDVKTTEDAFIVSIPLVNLGSANRKGLNVQFGRFFSGIMRALALKHASHPSIKNFVIEGGGVTNSTLIQMFHELGATFENRSAENDFGFGHYTLVLHYPE